ncbi:MAG: ATP-grasp domain-containing protein [Candidatus Magasanikbacteria bacterium]|nr:ATP-grasp domain-containing protein [Candidatus Magasanikbacteria bacterium]
MQELQQALNLRPAVYVTRDIERALGLPISTKNYFIVTNLSPFAKQVSKWHKNVLLIAGKKLLDTHELLSHPRTKLLLKKTGASVLVFKNTTQIEKICTTNDWQLLNPKAGLANRVEQKLSQLEWLGSLTKYLPKHEVMKCKDLTWDSETSPPVLPSAEGRRKRPSPLQRRGQGEVWPFIVQFNHAHTGLGTILIESQKQIEELKTQFPNREVRVTQFISGPVFTNNNVVWGKKVLCGNINYQITGLAPFTDKPFAAVGNDWGLPGKVLSSKQRKQYKQIATDVGGRLRRDGWKGLFGIDVIMDEKTRKLYLLEINARQPASTTFESQLQRSVILSETKNLVSPTRSFAYAQDDKLVTTFEAHLAALLGLPTTHYQLQTIIDGAQIIQRVSKIPPRGGHTGGVRPLRRQSISRLRNSGLTVIEYPNTKPGEDLLRIQSTKGIMKNTSEFNDIGKKIKNHLER